METDLRTMVMAFRVTELQSLLGFAGKNKTGRKTELQQRAMELVRSKQGPVATKIKELYRNIQYTLNQVQPPLTLTVTQQGGNYSIRSSSNSSRHYTASTGYADAPEKVLQGRNPFANYNSTQETKVSSNNNNNNNNNMPYVSMPICPDVKFKRLPFYDIMCELIKPTSLISNGPVRMQEGTFPFFLTPQQASDVMASKEILEGSHYAYGGEQKIGYQVQVQLRFCLLDSTCEQTDSFPPSICVRINGRIVPLPHPIPSNRPGIEAKRPSKPLNVTNYVKLSPSCTNTVGITWVSDGMCRGWVMCLYLVKKLTSANLLTRLKAKGPRPAEFTQGMIKEIVSIDDGDCQIAMTSLKVSTACPLGKCRMTQPCRASTCSHLQCFDASLFLQMNEKKPTWACPVCDKPIMFENLSIDGYFLGVINALSIHAGNEIEVLPDGTWKPIVVIKKEREDGPPSKRVKAEVLDNTICLDDDILIDDSPGPSSSSGVASDSSRNNNNNNKASKSVEVVDLTLSDSEDDESTTTTATTTNKNSNISTINTIEEEDEDEDDDEEEVVIPIRPRRRPPPILDDSSTSSSSSSSSNSSSGSSASSSSTVSSIHSILSHRSQKKKGPPKGSKTTLVSKATVKRSTSPAIITLDSASPSPEPVESRLGEPFHSSSSYPTGSSSNSGGHHRFGHMDSSHSAYMPSSDWCPWELTRAPGVGSSSSSALSHRRPSSPNLFLNPAHTAGGLPDPFSLESSSSRHLDSGFPLNDNASLNFNFDFLDCDQLYNNIASSSSSDFNNLW